MFQLMKKRTMRKISIPVLAGLFLAFAAAALLIGRSFWSTYRENAVHTVGQKEKNVQLFLNLIAETSQQLTAGDTVSTDLFGENGSGALSNRLGGLTQMNANILGAAFVYRDGHTLASPRTTGYPDLESLQKVPEIAAFLASGADSAWLVRTEQLAEYYDNKFYNKAYGALTFIRRVGLEDMLYGYLLLDIDPQYLFRLFTSGPESGTGAVLLRRDNGAVIQGKTGGMDAALLDFTREAPAFGGQPRVSWELSRMIFYVPLFGEYAVAAALPLDGVIRQIAGFLLAMLGLFLLCGALTLYIAWRLTRTIADPLERLYHTMHGEQLDEVMRSDPENTHSGSAG